MDDDDSSSDESQTNLIFSELMEVLREKQNLKVSLNGIKGACAKSKAMAAELNERVAATRKKLKNIHDVLLRTQVESLSDKVNEEVVVRNLTLRSRDNEKKKQYLSRTLMMFKLLMWLENLVGFLVVTGVIVQTIGVIRI